MIQNSDAKWTYQTTLASLNAFFCSGAIVPVGVTLATQNTFIAMSHKMVLVCQHLKYVPVNGAGFSVAAKPWIKNCLHKLGFWIVKNLGNFSIILIQE
jgi:hypothetical protein